MEHFAQVLSTANADAALAASLFHDGRLAIPELKDYLAAQGISIRKTTGHPQPPIAA
jgi:cyclase